MKLNPEEAAAALAEIERARTTMRQVIRAHRGHYHLWIWGVAWIAMPMSAHLLGDQAVRWFGLICIPFGIASMLVGSTQSRQLRSPINRRFLLALAALLVFAVVFPVVLQARAEPKSIYAYTCLVVMQCYVVAGIWTDTYLLWLGLLISALIITGLFFLPGVFWLWMAGFGGGALILSGVYVRHFWR